MEYLIGSGAILESGEAASITPAALHARVDPALARSVRAAAIDFEGREPAELRRLLLVVASWNARSFRTAVTEPLFAARECSLADVLGTLAEAAGTVRIDLFAHWLPDEKTCQALAMKGIGIVAHPLETIESAAVIAGQRHRRWKAVMAA